MKKSYHSIFIVVLFARLISSLISVTKLNQSHLSFLAEYPEGNEEAEKRDQTNEAPKSDPYLPDDLQPQTYELEMSTEISEMKSKYWGKVLITVKCVRSTNKIILNQKELLIHENDVEIKLSGSDPASFIPIKKHLYNSVYEQYIIILGQSLEKDKNYEIKIEYSRPKDTESGGLNKGYIIQASRAYGINSILGKKHFRLYDNQPDENKRMSYTSMSDTGARKVFPCFDQLGMKATFKIKLRHHSNMRGLSNAEKIPTKSEEKPVLTEDEFTETVPMEPNSVAIVLLDFYWKESTYSSSNTGIRIFASETLLLEKWRLVPGIATEVFRFFSDYFEVPYPFKKLDIIAMPAFHGGVEASYGVIYMSEDTALNGYKETSNSAKYKVVSEMCHSISQQWIGHTVTVSQWIDVWVHIALNIVLQTLCVIEMAPKWERDFIEPDIINMYLILSELHIRKHYDTFLVTGKAPTYLNDYTNKKLIKAYYLTRMIHFFLGQDIFQKGINNYLKKFKFSNSIFGDLWVIFTNTANTMQPHLLPNISVGEIMTSWLYQEGYPLITVTWKRETNEISISQTPFNVFEEETYKYKKRCWLIPLSYTTKTEISESKFKMNNGLREWLTCKGDLTLKIDMKEDDWFLLDLKVNVISRVNYDESIWIAIQKSLVNNEEPEVFNPLTRARLISDMFMFAEVGNLSYVIVLDAMKYLPREVNYTNWTIALRELDKIRALLIRSPVYKSFEKYVSELLEPVFQAYQNSAQNSGVDWKLELVIAVSSCQYDVEGCRRDSLALIKKWKHNKKNLDSFLVDIQKMIHCQGIKYGNGKHFKSVWNFLKQVDPTLRANIIETFGCLSSKSMINRLLEWSIDEKKVSSEESLKIFQSLTANVKGYKLQRTFFMDNFDRISAFHDNPGIVLSYWLELFNTTADKEDLDKLLQFGYSQGVMINPDIVLQQSLNRAEKNVAWLQQNEEIFENYFQNRAPKKRWTLFQN